MFPTQSARGAPSLRCWALRPDAGETVANGDPAVLSLYCKCELTERRRAIKQKPAEIAQGGYFWRHLAVAPTLKRCRYRVKRYHINPADCSFLMICVRASATIFALATGSNGRRPDDHTDTFVLRLRALTWIAVRYGSAI